MSKYKYHLEDVEWREFIVGGKHGIFEVFTGALIQKNSIKAGLYPRISATDSDNGVCDFTKVLDDKNYRSYDNFISISFLGSVFYQKHLCSLDMKIHGIKPKERELNKQVAHFLIPLVKKFASKYSYGNQLSTKVLSRQKLMLPIDKDGNPNWSFMEAYIKEREVEKKKQLIKYYKDKLVESVLDPDILSDVEWGEFLVKDLFDITIGKNLDSNKIDKDRGKTAYVTRKEVNNGVDGFTSGHDLKYLWDDVPVITIGNETAKPFVQIYPFYTGTKVNILSPKKSIGKETLSFIAISLENNKERYSYSYTANSTRLLEQRLLLPIDKNGEPNWLYMENFIKHIEQKKLKEVVEYLRKYIYIYI